MFLLKNKLIIGNIDNLDSRIQLTQRCKRARGRVLQGMVQNARSIAGLEKQMVAESNINTLKSSSQTMGGGP